MIDKLLIPVCLPALRLNDLMELLHTGIQIVIDQEIFILLHALRLFHGAL